LNKALVELCLVGQQGGHIRRLGNAHGVLLHQGLQAFCIDCKAGFAQGAGAPFGQQLLQAPGLQLLGGVQAQFIVKPELDPGCRYSVGRYSLCGVSQATSTSTSLALNSGVPPPPQKPTSTPALASSRIAAWVMEVPVPSRMLVVLAMGMFQYRLRLPASVTYSTRPPLTSTRQCSR
jgi:hypothetical protein